MIKCQYISNKKYLYKYRLNFSNMAKADDNRIRDNSPVSSSYLIVESTQDRYITLILFYFIKDFLLI
jgi:hypothetical protein